MEKTAALEDRPRTRLTIHSHTGVAEKNGPPPTASHYFPPGGLQLHVDWLPAASRITFVAEGWWQQRAIRQAGL